MKNIVSRFFGLKVRKNKRYRAKNGVFVIFENTFSINQVGDISMGGLSFYYEYKGAVTGKGANLLKVSACEDLLLSNLPFEMVSDSEAGAFVSNNIRIMRQSLRFGHMKADQKATLKQIIRRFTIQGKKRYDAYTSVQ